MRTTLTSGRAGLVAACLVGALVGGPRLAHAQGAPASPAPAAKVKANLKQLEKEVTDPKTPGKIKAREQEFEGKVKAIRDRQRKDHKARPGDVVDMAKSLDKPAPAAAPAPAPAKAATPTPAAGAKP